MNTQTSDTLSSHPINPMLKDPEKLNLLQNLFSSIWEDISHTLSTHPQLLFKSYLFGWQNYLTSYQDFTTKMQQSTNAAPAPDPTDFEQQPVFAMIKQSHTLTSQQLQNFVNEIAEHLNEKSATKLKFFTRQLLEALNPSNFIQTNPAALKSFVESNGENLVTGFKQFLQDAETSKVLLNIQSVDFSQFHIGENIAVTKGKVIFQNELIQLIQYTPNTKNVHEIPLLMVPPWINKYYILDLQPHNSLVQWLVNHGYSVFLISWVNPNKTHANEEFADYMHKGVLTALDLINYLSKSNKINVLGYCIGGTLLASTLAYLTAYKSKFTINSATFLTTLLDFSEPGDLGVFIDDTQLNHLDEYMQKNGYLDGEFMQAVFTTLRPMEMLWSNYVNRYLRGQKPATLDFLFWNADPTNIPAKVHSFYLREMYLNNHLAKHDGIKLSGTNLDLSKITIPNYFLAAQKDHITLWKSCYNSMRLLGGKQRFVLSRSGHVAGVVNPPDNHKYGYWTNSARDKNPDKWQENAEFHEGSWWNNWEAWLRELSGKLIPANTAFNKQPKAIEDAPGSYVKTKLQDITEA